jgi:hypothetical protein
MCPVRSVTYLSGRSGIAAKIGAHRGGFIFLQCRAATIAKARAAIYYSAIPPPRSGICLRYAMTDSTTILPRVDIPACPNCGEGMRLAKVEPTIIPRDGMETETWTLDCVCGQTVAMPVDQRAYSPPTVPEP